MYGIEARHDLTFYIDTLKSGWVNIPFTVRIFMGGSRGVPV